MNELHKDSVPAQGKRRGRKVVLICIVFIALLLVLAGCGVRLFIGAGASNLHRSTQESSYAKTIEVGGKTYTLNPHVVSILFIGIDKENGRAIPPHNGQADAIMLLAINEDTGKMTCLSIPRSAWTWVLDRNFENGVLSLSEDYLCLGFNYGYDDRDSSELICQDVTNVLNGIPVKYYYTLNMSGVGALADAVGGVSLTAMSDVVKTDIQAGDQLELTGDVARDYVWQRDTEDDYSSADRLERQQQFARAFAEKALEECKRNPLKMFELFEVAKDHSVTNLSSSEIAYLASYVASRGVIDIDVVSIQGEYVPIPDQPTKFIVDEMQLIQMIVDLFYTEA